VLRYVSKKNPPNFTYYFNQTANYTTLKEQTLKRIKEFGLYDESTNASIPVWLYNVRENINYLPHKDFQQRGLL